MKILCFFAIIFLLYNCTPNSLSYERIIENNSSYDLWIINSTPRPTCEMSSTPVFQDSVLIPSNTRYTLEVFNEHNVSTNDYVDCPFLCLDSLDTSISNHDSLSLTASLAPSNSDWEYTLINPGNTESCKCELTITDADIN